MSDDDDPGPNPRRALVGLLAILALIGAVMFIMHRLNQAAQIQDCVSSGRYQLCADRDARALDRYDLPRRFAPKVASATESERLAL